MFIRSAKMGGRERERENDIEKWRNSGEVKARGDRRVADDFARFPSTYGRRSPDRCPPAPLPSTSLPIFHLSKAITLLIPLSLPRPPLLPPR